MLILKGANVFFWGAGGQPEGGGGGGVFPHASALMSHTGTDLTFRSKSSKACTWCNKLDLERIYNVGVYPLLILREQNI